MTAISAHGRPWPADAPPDGRLRVALTGRVAADPEDTVPVGLDLAPPVGLDLAPSTTEPAEALLRDATSRSGRRRLATRFATLLLVGFVVAELLLHASKSASALTAVAHAQPAWVVAIAAVAAATYVMAAMCTIGSATVALRLRRTVLVQLASTFVNRFVPGGVGGAVLNVRYLERSGARRSEAVASNAMNAASGFVVHLALLAALVPFIGGTPRDIDPPDNSALLIAVLVALTSAGAVVWARWIPRHWKAELRTVRRAASTVVLRPARAALVIGGSAGITIGHGVALWFALQAVRAPLPITSVMAVYLVSAALGSISPTPGGLGAFELALVTALARTGEPAVAAAAGVLIYRFVTYWMPIAPGFVALRWLRRRNAV
jgi:undecaprenyl-diphosphatase